MLSYRGFYGSPDHLPIVALLDRISAARPFFFRIYDGTIGAQQTDRGQITMQDDCWLLMLMASHSPDADFVAQFYDTERQMIFHSQPVNFANGEGTAVHPFYLKKPQFLPAFGQLESRVINLAAIPNTIQIVGLAYRPDLRRKLT